MERRARVTDTKVEIYTSPFCGYCYRAKSLLKSKGIAFIQHDVIAEPRARDEMFERSGGRRTVPQIFVGTSHVGGCDDLFALESQGKLDPLLAGTPD